MYGVWGLAGTFDTFAVPMVAVSCQPGVSPDPTFQLVGLLQPAPNAPVHVNDPAVRVIDSESPLVLGTQL